MQPFFSKKIDVFFVSLISVYGLGKNRKIQPEIKKNVSRNSCSNYGKHRNIIRKNEKSRAGTEKELFSREFYGYFLPDFSEEKQTAEKVPFQCL